jgi:hypothetical protein
VRSPIREPAAPEDAEDRLDPPAQQLVAQRGAIGRCGPPLG